MERFGDFFPEDPQNLDELLEVMAQRMQAMQAMLNSMTPEQRAQLQGLAEQLLEDMDLAFQMNQLSDNLRQAFPDMGWNKSYDFYGEDPLNFADAAAMMRDLGDMDQLENPVRWPRPSSTAPASCSVTTPPTPSRRWPSSPRCSRSRGSSRTRRAASR